jgi:hypothetical protein
MTAAAPPIEPRWPGNRLPVTILLDDPTPCRNPAWHEFPEKGYVAVVPNSFTERFADLMDQTGAAGKFSVIPCPGARGRLDEGLPGVSDEDLAEFLRIVRDRIAPRWDLCPEMLSHNKALDLETMQPLDEREDVWASHQNESTLRPYISLGLQILRNVGLEPNGVTSPWQFGIEVEEDYARAIVTALREVCGVRVGWYFTHVDSTSPVVEPRVMHLDPAEGTALVSLVSAAPEIGPGGHDFVWNTQHGEPPATDSLLTADGASGRLAELFAHGGPLLFHTHWQSLFSNGSGAGLDGLHDLCERINRTWGDRIRWMPARELALYCAVRAAVHAETMDDGRRLTLRSPFTCPDFTFSFPVPKETLEISADGTPLREVSSEEPTLREGTWQRRDGTATVCLRLQGGMQVALG